MTNSPTTKVVIVGGGSAGWMAAAMLAKTLGPLVSIELVESAQIGTVGVGEATIPPIVSFNQALGLDEAEFLKRTKGTIKLAIQFEGWQTHGHDYMHTFGEVGRAHGASQFLPLWLRSKQGGSVHDLWDYSLNYQLAKQNKFGRLSKPNPLVNTIAYAYHFDAGLYAQLLREMAEKMGVKRIEGTIAEVNLAPQSGNIDSLVLDDGRSIKGELFIDCSGFRSLLLGQTLNVPYDNWQHWLPCDRAFAVQSESAPELRPYTRSIAHAAGWQWQIPLQHRIGNGMVFSSQYWDDETARQTLLNNLPAPAIGEPRLLKFVTGRYKKQWHRNCVALGLSSGFLEPLESTSLHLVQRGIARLIKLFPNRGSTSALAEEYNRQSEFEFEHIRDFLILHYHVNQRQNEAFWQYLRDMPIPDSLQHRLELFRASGQLIRNADELFAEPGWWQVLIGQGLMPDDYHRLADGMDDRQLSAYLEKIRHFIALTVETLPDHRKFIERL